MARELGSIPIHAAFEQWSRNAVAQVDRLDRSWFSNPALAGQLQKIADGELLRVAVLQKEGIVGQRREEPYRARDGFGGSYDAKRSWLDVSVPFVGDADSFRISPSSYSIPSHPVSIGNGAIVITVFDDDNAQRSIDTVVSQISQNLDRVRAEYERGKPQILEAVNRAAERRKSAIDAERARDSKLSFPIR